MALQERPFPQWTVARLLDALYAPELDLERLRQWLALPLPPSWQRLAQRRIDSGVVEDMAPRLDGPQAA
jgi:MOSC domain-containing protein YiiM